MSEEENYIFHIENNGILRIVSFNSRKNLFTFIMLICTLDSLKKNQYVSSFDPPIFKINS